MKPLLSTLPLNTDLGALLLRFILGGLMAYHGYQKLESYDMMLSMTQDIIGIGSKLTLNLLIFAEFFCGLLVVLGFLTRLTVIPIFIAMFVAYFVAHAKDAFQIKELAFIFLVLTLPVFVLGSGKFSLDRLLFKK